MAELVVRGFLTVTANVFVVNLYLRIIPKRVLLRLQVTFGHPFR